METPAARKGVDRLDDGAAGTGDRLQTGLEVVTVKNDEGRLRRLVGVRLEPAVETGIVGGGIGRAVIDKGPAEGLAVKGLQWSELAGREFDIVDVVMVFCHRMSSQTAAFFSAASSISAIVRTL